jgi:predicted DNA-binding protein (UPF0278 family)
MRNNLLTKDPFLIRLKKDKINHTVMQKIFNERRRKYKEYIRKSLGLGS